MPNHITTIIHFDADADTIESIREKVTTTGGKDESDFDFNKLIPMPESLMMTAGSAEDLSEVLLGESGNQFSQERIEKDHKELLASMDPIFQVTMQNADISKMNDEEFNKFSDFLLEHKDQIAELDERRYGNMEEAIQYMNNKRLYGHTSWYNWCCEKWGTKWNSYNVDWSDDTVQFDTAWSTPEPILKKLSEMYPNVRITVEYADENIGSNCGEAVLIAGNIVEYTDKQGDNEFACRIKGYDYDEYMADIEE